MPFDKDFSIDKILDSIKNLDYIKPENIPNIPLYMDQVTTFMDKQLDSSKRYEDDKVLTKTMINNYAKNNLLPHPEKKKYSKEHLLVLVFIYYFKNILSIKDIEKLMYPLTTTYFSNDKDFALEEIYTEVLNIQRERIDSMIDDIKHSYDDAQKSFTDANEEDEFLRLFSFICSLSMDVYIKKQIIENLIDQLPDIDKKKK